MRLVCSALVMLAVGRIWAEGAPAAQLQESAKGQRILCIAQTPSGIWIGTDSGIHGAGAVKKEIGPSQPIQRPTAIAAWGDAVIVYTEHGLLRFQKPDKWELKVLPSPPLSLAVDGARLLVGTENGLYVLTDWNAKESADAGQIDPDLLLEPAYFILSIHPTADAIFVGTQHGLGRIDRKSGKGVFAFKQLNTTLQAPAIQQILSHEGMVLATSAGLARRRSESDAWQVLQYAKLNTSAVSKSDEALEDLMNDIGNDEPAPGGEKIKIKKAAKQAALPPSSDWIWSVAVFSNYLVAGTRAGLWVQEIKSDVWRLVTPADKKLSGSWVTALQPDGERLLIGTDQGLEIWTAAELEGLFTK